MKVVIIEDEKITAEDLMQTIEQSDASIEITAVLKSVADGIAYFRSQPVPDLIFSDIRLGDGLSFEILSDLKIPVIFCTAYDEYALNAFKANGIDYILKPFTLASVTTALQKYKSLAQIGQEEITRQYESIKRLFTENVKIARETALLIRYKEKIIPVKIETVALFCLDDYMVHLLTFDGNIYYPGKSLEELERMVGDDFFRVNRRYLVNRKAIVNVSSLLSRKLSVSVSVKTKDDILISKEKASAFLKWLSGIGEL
jgi:DNA-binding LytR/AlgR family response regulator